MGSHILNYSLFITNKNLFYHNFYLEEIGNKFYIILKGDAYVMEPI